MAIGEISYLTKRKKKKKNKNLIPHYIHSNKIKMFWNKYGSLMLVEILAFNTFIEISTIFMRFAYFIGIILFFIILCY